MQTKYNVGDQVYFIDNNKVNRKIVRSIFFNGIEASYNFDGAISRHESEVHISLDELFRTLAKNFGNK